MKMRSSIFVRLTKMIFVLFILAFGFSAPAHCQTKDVTLMLRQSPVAGGSVTPNTGIHHFTADSQITLIANPKPGYRFIQWLGDVSDPAANSTIVYLDEPKVVIAVFEQTENGALDLKKGMPAGGGGLIATSADFYQGTDVSYAGGVKQKTQWTKKTKYKNPDVVVPEPATGVLLLLGGLFTMTRRKQRNSSR